MEDTTPVLLVTANVGSIFEDPDVMINPWIQEFLQTVTRFDAEFVALHCQEVGGKNYETRMQHVDNFVELLASSEALKSYTRAVVFLDEDFSCAENFTALGNFYFIHERVKELGIWNFKKLVFEPIEGKKIFSGNIEDIEVKEKCKFPQNFFPECKWSRKGHLRTRWNLNGSIFDLVNIHLFHDASNFVAMQSFPSVYTVTRQKALQYTLNRFYDYVKGYAPFFLFGDFNFRTDTQGVVKKLASGLNEYKESDSNNDDTRLEYKDDTSEVVITIGKKEFIHSDHQNVFVSDSAEWLKEFDREMEAFKDQLFEFPITFLPSYPFEENCSRGQSYMKTRCPAWCDRVLLSMNAKEQLIVQDENNYSVEYSVIGKDSCMGDHKPVYLFVRLRRDAGIITSKLPLQRVCPACKLSSSIFCDAFNESPLALKSHFNSSFRNDTLSVNNGVNTCKIHYRNTSRCYDANISPMSTVTELSDRTSNADTDIYYLANAVSPLNSCVSMDNCRTNDSIPNSFADECPLSDHHQSEGNDMSAKMRRYHFAEDNISLNRFHDSKEFVSRSFDESSTIRSNSTMNMADSSWRSKTCTCLHDIGWRMRSVSTSSRTSSWNSDSRVRLKSDPNLKTSLPRIQSHHSSSDEEWFEEVAENTTESASQADLDATRNNNRAIEEIEECIEFDAPPRSSNDAVCAPLTQQVTLDKDNAPKKKYFLFCIPKNWRKKNSTRVKTISDYKLKKKSYFRFLPSKSRKCKFCCVS